MTYKPDYSIDLPNGKVFLLFNSWTFREYSNKIGIELDDLYELIKSGKAIKSKDLSTLLLVAAESFCLFNDVPFNYKEIDSFKWIDDLGGYNSMKFMDVFKVFIGKFLNISPEQFDILWQKAVEPPKNADGKKKTRARN